MGTWMPETCREEKKINILNRIVQLVGFICEITYTEMYSQQNIEFLKAQL